MKSYNNSDTLEQQFYIDKHFVGKGLKPFVVAEMSGNHNQSLERAMAIIDAAAAAGAHAIKLQTYTADILTMPGVYRIEDPNSLWNQRELHDLYKEAYTPWEWHKPLFDHAAQKGITMFSSPFDESAVDFLEELGCPAYKIASFENAHHPLLKKVAGTGKPVIVSTGISTLESIDKTVRILRESGCEKLFLLKCTSTYPATPENTNLRTIPHLSEMFGVPAGLSDHTMGIGAAVAAVALGAVMIEKHFCLSREEGGVDSAFSLEPAELAALVTETERAWLAMGQVKYGVDKAEEKSISFKRSIYVSEDIRAGESFSENNIRIIRPGYGLSPEYYEMLIGKICHRDLKKGTPLTWDNII